MKNSFLLLSLKNAKLYILLITILGIISAYLITLIPLYIKYALDGVVYGKYDAIPEYITYFFYDNSYQSKLLIICLFLLIINLINAVIKFFQSKIVLKFNIKVNVNVKSIILNHTANLDYQTFLKTNNREIVQRVNNDSQIYTNFLDTKLTMLLDFPFIFIFSVYNAMKLNLEIGIYILICVACFLVLTIIYAKKSYVCAKQKVAASEIMIGKVNENINNIKIIKMYNKEKDEQQLFDKISKNYKDSNFNVLRTSKIYDAICHTIDILKDAIVITIGGYFVVKGTLSLGSLTALLIFAQTAISRGREITKKLIGIGEFYLSYQRLKDYLNLKVSNNHNPIILNGDIIFDNVSIKLNETCLLKNLNFKLKKNESFVLVGDNGTGKSILLKTILGLYEYTGNIYIGNINIKDLNSKQITDNISMVSQEPFLFNATIKDNICFGKEDYELEKITKKCDIYDDIMKFEKNFDTMINENSNLSGGQKQRVVIARSLHQNKKYILFDDSFSKLDTITKHNILDNIINLGKTAIIVSYDYEIAKKINKILFIDNKTIIYDTHENLMEGNTNYKRMMQINRNNLGDEYE